MGAGQLGTKKYKKRSSRAAKAHVRILAGTHTAKNSYFNKTEQMIVERKELKNGQNEMVAEKKQHFPLEQRMLI